MNSVLNMIENDNVIIYKENCYNHATLKKCKSIFDKLKKEGQLRGEFTDDRWLLYSDIDWTGISFFFDDDKYDKHAGKRLGIKKEILGNILRCFAIFCSGSYIYTTIAQKKLEVVVNFLENFGDKGYKILENDAVAIEEFLSFISTPEEEIIKIMSSIRQIRKKKAAQRKMSPIINYMAIQNEINYLYSSGLDDDTFKRWFPIFFWVNITFILPLRATEMLVTPCDCLERDNGKVYLTVRRTLLKGRNKKVYYDVKKDYGKFSYKMPDDNVMKIIERYVYLTKSQERRFLFEYNENMVNEMLSLQAFNRLLESFIKENLIGNLNYEYAKNATGIDEFEVVTAGDSRPIAMANLYFSDAGADICRQLANHVNINTSAGYYSNISEIIMASSIMQFQKKIDYRDRNEKNKNVNQISLISEVGKSTCSSAKRAADPRNLDDCIAQQQLEDCMGCKFYRTSEEELERYLAENKNNVDRSSKRAQELLNGILRIKDIDITADEVLLNVQKDAARYKVCCDIKSKENYDRWVKNRDSKKTSF